MTQTFTLVLGTHNKKKRVELERLLLELPIQLLTLDDFENSIDVEETGTTFAENAALKATEQARHLGHWVLGEDSGLSVDALDGAPGVYSARFSGEDATDEKNNMLLLERLKTIPLENRTAHYTCSMALADPTGTIHMTGEAYCCGRILSEPSGEAGFGYDPLFEIPEYHLTFGMLGDTIKSVLSHRARAHRLLVPKLMALVGNNNQLNEQDLPIRTA